MKQDRHQGPAQPIETAAVTTADIRAARNRYLADYYATHPEATEKRRQYNREYRAGHRQQAKEAQLRYWAKKAAAYRAGKNGSNNND